jgi:hypothetical protein
MALAGTVAVTACRPQPTTPAVPPRGPNDPTNGRARLDDLRAEDVTDAAIAPDAAPALDASGIGLDAGVPLGR